MNGCAVDCAEAELINGSEGKNLLSALTVFVTAAMNSALEAPSKQGEAL